MAQADQHARTEAPPDDAESHSPRRWTQRGSDWLAIRLSWGMGDSLRAIAEFYGVDRAAVQARARAERWPREVSDAEMLALTRRITLARGVRAMLKGAGEVAIAAGREIGALERVIGLKRARVLHADAGAEADVEPDADTETETGTGTADMIDGAPDYAGEARATQTGETAHDQQHAGSGFGIGPGPGPRVGAGGGGRGAAGGYDDTIRRAILERLARLGICVADAGARLPAGERRQPQGAARQMAPPDGAGAGADAA